jgi:hypothetical protein
MGKGSIESIFSKKLICLNNLFYKIIHFILFNTKIKKNFVFLSLKQVFKVKVNLYNYITNIYHLHFL